MSDHNSEHGPGYSDPAWPMCGRAAGYECETCSRVGKPCYCDGGKP
jgi:hypothetical protein